MCGQRTAPLHTQARQRISVSKACLWPGSTHHACSRIKLWRTMLRCLSRLPWRACSCSVSRCCNIDARYIGCCAACGRGAVLLLARPSRAGHAIRHDGAWDANVVGAGRDLSAANGAMCERKWIRSCSFRSINSGAGGLGRRATLRRHSELRDLHHSTKRSLPALS